MKVVDIHPEELIDKLHAGELSRAEQERLDAHLAQCSGCRFEIGVRADLEQEAPLFEQRPQLTFAGQAAPRTAQTPPSAPRVQASVRPRARRRWPLVMLAAALVLCAGGATAAVVTGAFVAPKWLPWSSELKPQKSASAVSASDLKVAHRLKRALKAVAESESAPAPSVTATALAPAEAAVPVAEPVSGLSEAAPAREAVHAPRAAVSNPVPASAVFPSVEGAPASASQPAPDVAPRPDPAASLFADANRARRDGNVDRAVLLYHSLQTRYPSSSESELSRALLAQMLLERGNPEAALASFDRYLAEGAPVLGAEALVGRARALEQLGKSEQAALAWQQVQSKFPGSVHARLAAARLAALGR